MLIELIVEEAVEFMFGDWLEGHGIGTSDVSACVNDVMYQVRTGSRCTFIVYLVFGQQRSK